MDKSIEELETLVKENIHRRPVLAGIKVELTHRKTNRARQLLREVEGILDGELPLPPKPPRPPQPHDQLGLMDE